jgi:NADH-quinone oxidoreductase subunit G
MTNRSVFPPGDAREDWAIIRALSDGLGRRLPFDSLGALRRALYERHPHLARVEQIAPADGAGVLSALSGLGGWPGHDAFAPVVHDFYLTNPIARASRVMAECSALAGGSSALQAAE